MGHLLKRVQRILRGKLSRLIPFEPVDLSSGAPGGPECGPEPGDARPPGGAASRAVDERRARAFAVLEVVPGAGSEELRSAYRRLCRKYHPDRFADDEQKSLAANELLAEVNAAYELVTGGGAP